MTRSHQDFMRLAIQEARTGIASGQSPFGAVVVRDGEVVAAGRNQVWIRTDPTAHAEIVCIQNAAKALQTIDFRGCEMYTTTEPCPMCAAAIHWSKFDAVYFGARIADAKLAGFTELTLPIEDVYVRGGSPVRTIPGLLSKECIGLFSEWVKAGGRAY